MTNRRVGVLALGLLFIACCIAACQEADPLKPKPSVRLEGIAADWRSGAPLPGAVIETVGVSPVQMATAGSDGSFTLVSVPINGFVLLTVVAADHVPSVSSAILVGEDPLEGVIAQAVSDADVALFESGFAVTSTAGRGVVLGRAQTLAGAGISAVAAISVLSSAGAFEGPYFIAADGSPAPGALETTADGGFLFFNVIAGDLSVAATASNLVFESQATVVMANSWSIVTLPGDGPGVGGSPTPTPGPPGPQSFADDIVPIFTSRGCTGSGCHRPPTNGGGLRLNQSAGQIYAAVLSRCNTANPPNSLLLTKPLFEAAPNHIGGNVFLTTNDPDYQRMLRWITDGAPNN